MTAADIAKELGGRESGASWVARCPAHDNTNPSLSLRETKHAPILAKFHAGCEQAVARRRDE